MPKTRSATFSLGSLCGHHVPNFALPSSLSEKSARRVDSSSPSQPHRQPKLPHERAQGNVHNFLARFVHVPLGAVAVLRPCIASYSFTCLSTVTQSRNRAIACSTFLFAQIAAAKTSTSRCSENGLLRKQVPTGTSLGNGRCRPDITTMAMAGHLALTLLASCRGHPWTQAFARLSPWRLCLHRQGAVSLGRR